MVSQYKNSEYVHLFIILGWKRIEEETMYNKRTKGWVGLFKIKTRLRKLTHLRDDYVQHIKIKFFFIVSPNKISYQHMHKNG